MDGRECGESVPARGELVAQPAFFGEFMGPAIDADLALLGPFLKLLKSPAGCENGVGEGVVTHGVTVVGRAVEAMAGDVVLGDQEAAVLVSVVHGDEDRKVMWQEQRHGRQLIVNAITGNDLKRVGDGIAELGGEAPADAVYRPVEHCVGNPIHRNEIGERG